jgi:capsular exopolysaccharide synthesis family protein
MLGVGATFFRQHIDTRLYTPDDIEQEGYRLLAALPDLTEMIKKQCSGEATVAFKQRRVSSRLVALFDPSSAEAEAYRRLHMALIVPRKTAMHKSFLFTSAEEGAGKSTVSLNLAITMGKAGRRVVVVDADLFRPSVHTMLDVAAGEGLDALLRRQEPDISPQAMDTGLENVWALSSPRPVIHAGEMFGSDKAGMLIEKLCSAFDVVLIDAPPVLVATDAAFLSAMCEATVLVVNSGVSDAEALKQSVDTLSRAGASIKGVVLNRFDPSRVYGYRYTYGYMYQDHTQSIPRV